MKKTLSVWVAALLMLVAVSSCVPSSKGIQELGKDVKVGQWYYVNLPGAVNSDGSQWNGYFRKGKLNKVIVLFSGGGVSVDSYTAARGMSVVPKGESFYIDKMNVKDSFFLKSVRGGIASIGENNPFRDWTIVYLPYTTGDFHCGRTEKTYTNIKGENDTIFYHGYINYTMMMEKVLPYLGTPDALLITGFSAGGFGTSILSEDVVKYFPNTKNITSCVDASLLVHKDCKRLAQEEWNAPKEIVDRINGDNLSLECLKSLHKNCPDIKILFTCSARDETLTFFQHYFIDGTRPVPTREDGEAFEASLRNMVKEFQDSIPEGGVFIWNDIVTKPETGLTQHTIEILPEFLTDRSGNGSIASWINNAVNGKVESKGLDLIAQ
ncbi:MAG TPA: pectin acetylesterase [Porphyromonadaceae bacterium]|nr:pectin acetylesterase [Porphyromonadaceae bacterium]